MKKNLLSIIVCVIAIFAISSCNLFKGEETSEERQGTETTVNGIPQEIKNKIAAQDTLMNALVWKVDTLSQALTQVQKENKELGERVEKLEKPKRMWNYITFVTLAIAIAAFILSLFRNGVSRKEVHKILKENQNNSKKIKELQEQLIFERGKCKKTSSSVNPSLSNLDARLRNVENKLSQLVNIPNGVQNKTSSVSVHPSKNPEYIKKKYARINSGCYFTQIFDSKQEGCVFCIELKAENRGEFNIISLNQIKSSNGWETIVECEGCSISDATHFDVERYGVCEKNGDMWEITKNLKIKLS